MTGIRNTRKKRRAEKNLVDTRIMRSFGETPGKREALLNKLVKISETPVKREETPEKGEEPGTALCGTWLRLAISEKERGWIRSRRMES